MKKLLVLFLSFCAVTTAFAGSYRNRNAYSYSSWDQRFSSNYHYSERSNYSSCPYSTCFDGYYAQNYQRTVYVEEAYIQGGQYNEYRRVVVYTDPSYSSPYATYYISPYNTVIRRTFNYNNSYVYQRDYYYDTSYNSNFYYELDRQTALIAVGAGVTAIGVGMLSNADSEGEFIAGGVVSLLGSISMAVGSAQTDQPKGFSADVAKLEMERQNAADDID